MSNPASLAAAGRDAIQRILVRGPNWAGDLVMSTPGFRALREGFPGAHIALHVRPGLEPLMQGAPWFDETLPVRSYHRGGLALVREGLALRGRRFDLGVCLPDSISSALLMRAAGVKRITGYRRDGRDRLLHYPVTPEADWGRRRMVARERFVLGLMESLGCERRGTHLELFTTSEEEARAEGLLGQHESAAASGPIAVLAPGASYGESKLWPAVSFARVGDALARSGARVVLVGSPDESVLTQRVAAAMFEPVQDLAGKLDLGALKAVVRRASVLVCNDAGARHVAVAFGVPAVVLMGPTSLEKTNLNLESVEVLEANDVDCRPCYHRECPIDHRCMTRIHPDAVASAALRAIEKHGASR